MIINLSLIGQVINQNSDMNMKNFKKWRWREKCFCRYESAWSLVHKFAVLNCVSPKEIESIFCRDLNSMYLPTPSNRNCGVWGSLSDRKISEILHLPSSDLSFAVISAYTIHLSGDYSVKPISAGSYLIYCDTCIEAGFHSPIFQLPWISRCPVHDIPLLSSCISCNEKIPYSYDSDAILMPYGCPCGNILWQGRDAKQWKPSLSNQEKHKLNSFVNLMLRSGKHSTNRLFHFALMDGPWSCSKVKITNRLPGYLLNAINAPHFMQDATYKESGEQHFSYPINTNSSFCIYFSTDPPIPSRSAYNNNINFNRIKSSISIYKCTKRMLQRVVLLKHKNCQKILRRVPFNWNTKKHACSLAMSFEKWESYWDNYTWYGQSKRNINFYNAGPHQWILAAEEYLNKYVFPEQSGARITNANSMVNTLMEKILSVIFLERLLETFLEECLHHGVAPRRLMEKATPLESSFFLIKCNTEGCILSVDLWQKSIFTMLDDISQLTNLCNSLDFEIPLPHSKNALIKLSTYKKYL